MGVKRYRARRSQKGFLKMTSNGHYDFKFKRLKYVGLAKGLQDAANAEFVYKTLNRFSEKLNNEFIKEKKQLSKHLETIDTELTKKLDDLKKKFLQWKDELNHYVSDSLGDHITKINKRIGEEIKEMKKIVEVTMNHFEIRTAEYVQNEDNKVKNYVDNSKKYMEKKIKELNESVSWIQHDLYPTHENKTTSALYNLEYKINDRLDNISKSVDE